MQFTTIVPLEILRKHPETGENLVSHRGGFVKDPCPAGTVFEGADHIDKVIFGVALPSDPEARALCQEQGIDIKAAVKGRKILETVDLAKEIEG